MSSIKRTILIITGFFFTYAPIYADIKKSVPPRSMYRWSGSVDNFIKPFFHSQQTSIDIILSMAYSFAYCEDQFGIQANWPLLTLGSNIYLADYIKRVNHEYTGHGLQAQMFNWPIQKIKVSLFDGLCDVGLPINPPPCLQEQALWKLGGCQANDLLAQKILEHALLNGPHQLPANFIQTLYYMVATDQLYYSVQSYIGLGDAEDINCYIEYMEELYGKDSITLKQIASFSLIDLMGPLLACFQARFTINHVPYWGSVSIFPTLNLILTPYNVLEKRLSFYGKTDRTPFKLTIGVGQESKKQSAEAIQPCEAEADPTQEIQPAFDDKALTEHYTFYASLDLYRLSLTPRLNLGLSLTGWQQPQLFMEEPIKAPMAWGGMMLTKWTYSITDQWDMFIHVGYKTTGFMLGYPPKSTSIVRLGVSLLSIKEIE